MKELQRETDKHHSGNLNITSQKLTDQADKILVKIENIWKIKLTTLIYMSHVVL